jgi:hypothetical protein
MRLISLFAALLLMPLALVYAGDGWRELFNGKDLDGWQDSSGKPVGPGWAAEEGALVLKKKGGYIWTKERFGDFILDLEVKTAGNSGVFIRTDNLRDPVQTGIEIQVDNPSDKPGTHAFGSFYDLVAPRANPAKKGEWTRLVIRADKNLLSVDMNGQTINAMDLDRWSEPGKNADGTKNKYKTALKDFKREGHIGFQDHGAAVMYRNIKIKKL